MDKDSVVRKENSDLDNSITGPPRRNKPKTSTSSTSTTDESAPYFRCPNDRAPVLKSK